MKRAKSGLAALLWAACLWLGCAQAESFESEHAVISFVRSLAETCLGEGETVGDVILENNVLSLRIDLSGGKIPTTVTAEDVARDRAGGISDVILSHPELDEYWEAIRIYAEPVFAVEYTKNMIVSQDWGRYFKSGNRLEPEQASGTAKPTTPPLTTPASMPVLRPAAASTQPIPTPAPTQPAFTPMPTQPAPTAEPTLPAAETASPGVHGTVNMNHVNVREGAGLEYGRIDTLNQGAQLIILGEERTLSGETWYIVRYEETRGFVRGDLVDVSDAVPVQFEPQPRVESGASMPVPTNYAGLSDEALRQMFYDLTQEALARQQKNALELPVGTYGVGAQIPPGEYAVSTRADLCVVEVYSSSDQYAEGYTLTAADTVGRMVLKQGMSMVISLGSVTLQTFYSAGEPTLP